MKKRTVLFTALACILVLTLILAGCSSAKTTTTTTSAVTSAPATSAPPTSKTTAPAQTTTSAPAGTTTAPPKTTTNAPTATTTPPKTSVVAPQTGGILTIISPNAPTVFGYPLKNTGFAPNFVNPPVLESFIDADIKGNILPKLATSWVIAPDKSSITFSLRQGVKFHDGSDFNAKVAKWNLDLYLARGTGSPADWKSIDIVDDYTLRINLKAFKNTQLSNMTYPMISQAAVEKNGIDWATTHSVGTGPFQFKSFVANTSLEYTRFDGYWGDKAYVDGIKYIFIVDATTAGMAFQAGDALVWESADAQTSYNMLQAGGYHQENRRGPLMNLIPDSANASSPFANTDVRKALEYAIDKQAIVKALGFGSWEAVNQPDVPEQFGYVADLPSARNYNPVAAKNLLAQAGYPNGFKTTIITSSALPKEPLVAIQDYLSAVGIQVTIDVQSAAKWADTRKTGWTNGLFYVTHGATDYNYCAYLERYYTPTSASAYPVLAYPADWLSTVNTMMLSADPAVMKAYAQQLVKMHVDVAMVIPIFVRSEVYLENAKVHEMGVGTHGDGFSWNYNKVWISK